MAVAVADIQDDYRSILIGMLPCGKPKRHARIPSEIHETGSGAQVLQFGQQFQIAELAEASLMQTLQAGGFQ